MASVNRESLRRSFDEQKRTFERLKRDGAMTPESIALIDALMTLLELLIAVFMEKTTTKTGRNSGLPSSRAPQDETARGAPGARGRGPKENAAAAANTRVVTGREESVVEQCWSCGADLAGAACAGHERRTLIDIVFETVEHHVDAQIKRCPRCRAETRGRFPGNMPRCLIRMPPCRRSAAMVRRVSATTRNRMSNTRLQKAMAAISAGRVNTTSCRARAGCRRRAPRSIGWRRDPAGGAVPVAAGVVERMLAPAPVAAVHVPAERGGAAGLDRAHDLEPNGVEMRSR